MLTTAICSSVLCLLAAISIPHVEGKPEIVKPLPLNIHPIEFEKAQVSCTIKQSAGGAKPTKIHYVRKSKFGDTDLIYDEGKDGRIHYENKTEDNGRKLTVILHFNNVTVADDSIRGGYECHGFDGDDGEECLVSKTCEPYGFTVNVIRRYELPGIAVSESKTVKFGDDIVLSCNLTTQKNVQTTKLRKLMWTKDGKVIDEVLYPREQSLKSQAFKVTDPSDGGLFSCLLISKLRNVQDYNVTDDILVKVEPKFFTEELKDNEVKVFKGDSAKFVCSAKGNPLNTVWKKKLKSEESVNAFDMADNSSKKYEFTNLDKFEDHTLVIKDTAYSDRGFYYCCLQEMPVTSNNTRDEDDVEGCQMFTLRVKDPLGALWPVIGIIIEVILLIIIIVLAEKFKKKKNQSTKTDGRVEFSYSSTDDATADKGQVRLRPSAAAASSETGEKA